MGVNAPMVQSELRQQHVRRLRLLVPGAEDGETAAQHLENLYRIFKSRHKERQVHAALETIGDRRSQKSMP
jgi:hypothetical protein